MKKMLLLIIPGMVVSCNSRQGQATKSPGNSDLATVSRATQEASSPAMDSVAEQKNLNNIMMPGDMHNLLASATGEWVTEETYRANENEPPQKSAGTTENKMIPGGRFLQTVHKSIIGGKPYEGIGIMGYDNNKRMFVSNWQDNASTGMVYYEGTLDSAAKTITMKANYDDSHGRTELKEVMRFTDDTHEDLEDYGTRPGGKEVKIFEMKMTKK